MLPTAPSSMHAPDRPSGGTEHPGSGAAHGHAHPHHHHHHAPDAYNRAFAAGVALNLAFVVLEVVFGLRAGSLALVADAGHNLGDVLGLALAWTAALLARRRPTPRRTYGLRSSSILAALANAVVLLVTVGAIVAEAVTRIRHPAPVASHTLVWVALVGIVINTGTALLFLSGRDADLNLRGAFLHMAADALVSLGVVVTGIAIAVTGWLWLDPAVSLVVAVVITVGTWGLLRDAVNLALHAVPAGIDAGAVDGYLRNLPGVADVHDLHIWGMSTTDAALTAHLVVPNVGDDDGLLLRACRELHDRFAIEHSTIQVERHRGAAECRLASAEVV